MPTRNLLACLAILCIGAAPALPDPACAALSAPYTLRASASGDVTRDTVRNAVRARVDAIQRASGESLVHIAHARAFAAGRGNLTI